MYFDCNIKKYVKITKMITACALEIVIMVMCLTSSEYRRD